MFDLFDNFDLLELYCNLFNGARCCFLAVIEGNVSMAIGFYNERLRLIVFDMIL